MKLILLLSITLACSAETLVLQNGKSVAGKLLGMDSKEVRLQRCGHVEKYTRADVKSISLEENTPAEPCVATAAPPVVELPSGTKIGLYLLDFIDSTLSPPGQVFRAEVEVPVKMSGQIVVSVHSRVILKLVDVRGPRNIQIWPWI